MGWARIDDGFDDHPKVLELLDRDEDGWAAITLWTLCLTWAHRNTRRAGKVGGLLPAGLPRRFLGGQGRTAAALLVEVGLWDVAEDGGWLIHDFAEYLPSQETRRARSEAGRKGAEARWRGKRRADGTDQDAGSATADGKQSSGGHADDGNEPSPSQEAAGKAGGRPMANDGSRTRARRAPTPTPGPDPEPSSPQPPSRETRADRPGADAASAWAGGGEEGEDPSPGPSGRDAAAQVIQMGLVAEIQQIRPEWSAASIRRALEHPHVGERPAELVRAAFVLVASDPETQHPGRLAHDGPWWSQAARQVRPHPARPAWCGRCESDTRRMVELGDGRVQRCPECHPLEAKPA